MKVSTRKSNQCLHEAIAVERHLCMGLSASTSGGTEASAEIFLLWTASATRPLRSAKDCPPTSPQALQARRLPDRPGRRQTKTRRPCRWRHRPSPNSGEQGSSTEGSRGTTTAHKKSICIYKQPCGEALEATMSNMKPPF